MLQAAQGLATRHGRIDRLDSIGEHWLSHEGSLRDELDVPGPRALDVARLRSKLAMAEVFTAAGVPCVPGVAATTPEIVRGFARAHGFPLVIKPDQGSGAVDTFSLANDAQLEDILTRSVAGSVVQPFVTGDIVTFDGRVDGAGDIVFCTSHTYDTGIMQVRHGALDGYYYSERVLGRPGVGRGMHRQRIERRRLADLSRRQPARRRERV